MVQLSQLSVGRLADAHDRVGGLVWLAAQPGIALGGVFAAEHRVVVMYDEDVRTINDGQPFRLLGKKDERAAFAS